MPGKTTQYHKIVITHTR